MKINIKEKIGSNLESKEMAEKLYQNIDENALEVEMDFDGVESINPSFAQEYMNQKNEISSEIKEVNISNNIKGELYPIVSGLSQFNLNNDAIERTFKLIQDLILDLTKLDVTPQISQMMKTYDEMERINKSLIKFVTPQISQMMKTYDEMERIRKSALNYENSINIDKLLDMPDLTRKNFDIDNNRYSSKNEINELKNEINELKNEINELKNEINELKNKEKKRNDLIK